MRKLIITIGSAALLTFVVVLSGCSNRNADQDSNASATKIRTGRIVAVSYPYQFLAQAIAGPEIKVEFPVPSDSDPRIWQPGVEAIQNMQAADLVIAGGTGIQYAEWLERVSLPESKLLNVNQALNLQDFVHVKDYRVVHTHGPGGEHSHPLMIPYCWMNPGLTKKIAIKIQEKLASIYPEREREFRNNLTKLNSELDKLEAQFTQLKSESIKALSLNPNSVFLTRTAGIDDNFLLWLEPGANPDEQKARETELAEKLQKTESTLVVSTTRFGTQRARAAGLQNIRIVEIDLMNHAPREGNYLSVMQANISRLSNARN